MTTPERFASKFSLCPSDVELVLVRLLLHHSSVSIVYLRLVLILLKEGEHFSMLLLQPLYIHKVPLDVYPHCLLFLFHLFKLLFVSLPLRARLHQ